MIAIMLLPKILAELDAVPIRASSGELLFARDSPVRHLFVVESGLVHLIRHQEDGKPAVMQRALAGDIVAEASIFASSYHCDGVVIADAELKRVPMRRLRERLRTDPDFASACAQHLADEVRRMRIRSEIMGMRTVSARLQAWLTWNGGKLPAKGQWRSLAEDIGVSPEALYRELAVQRRG